MSALSEASTPAHDNHQPVNTNNIHDLQHHIDNHLNQGHPQQQQQQQQGAGNDTPTASTTGKGKQRRSSPIPRIRRACIACHQGKTRCSEVLPCQSCLKRNIGDTCTYPDPENDIPQQNQANNQQQQQQPQQPSALAPPAAFAPPAFGQIPPVPQFYHDYYPPTSTFRPNKRPRPLTEDEAAAITRNFQRGDFFVGSSAPVRIDPRLPVRLTLGEGDQVHFTISEAT